METLTIFIFICTVIALIFFVKWFLAFALTHLGRRIAADIFRKSGQPGELFRFHVGSVGPVYLRRVRFSRNLLLPIPCLDPEMASAVARSVVSVAEIRVRIHIRAWLSHIFSSSTESMVSKRLVTLSLSGLHARVDVTPMPKLVPTINTISSKTKMDTPEEASQSFVEPELEKSGIRKWTSDWLRGSAHVLVARFAEVVLSDIKLEYSDGSETIVISQEQATVHASYLGSVMLPAEKLAGTGEKTQVARVHSYTLGHSAPAAPRDIRQRKPPQFGTPLVPAGKRSGKDRVMEKTTSVISVQARTMPFVAVLVKNEDKKSEAQKGRRATDITHRFIPDMELAEILPVSITVHIKASEISSMPSLVEMDCDGINVNFHRSSLSRLTKLIASFPKSSSTEMRKDYTHRSLANSLLKIPRVTRLRCAMIGINYLDDVADSVVKNSLECVLTALSLSMTRSSGLFGNDTTVCECGTKVGNIRVESKLRTASTLLSTGNLFGNFRFTIGLDPHGDDKGLNLDLLGPVSGKSRIRVSSEQALKSSKSTDEKIRQTRRVVSQRRKEQSIHCVEDIDVDIGIENPVGLDFSFKTILAWSKLIHAARSDLGVSSSSSSRLSLLHSVPIQVVATVRSIKLVVRNEAPLLLTECANLRLQVGTESDMVTLLTGVNSEIPNKLAVSFECSGLVSVLKPPSDEITAFGQNSDGWERICSLLTNKMNQWLILDDVKAGTEYTLIDQSWNNSDCVCASFALILSKDLLSTMLEIRDSMAGVSSFWETKDPSGGNDEGKDEDFGKDLLIEALSGENKNAVGTIFGGLGIDMSPSREHEPVRPVTAPFSFSGLIESLAIGFVDSNHWEEGQMKRLIVAETSLINVELGASDASLNSPGGSPPSFGSHIAVKLQEIVCSCNFLSLSHVPTKAESSFLSLERLRLAQFFENDHVVDDRLTSLSPVPIQSPSISPAVVRRTSPFFSPVEGSDVSVNIQPSMDYEVLVNSVKLKWSPEKQWHIFCIAQIMRDLFNSLKKGGDATDRKKSKTLMVNVTDICLDFAFPIVPKQDHGKYKPTGIYSPESETEGSDSHLLVRIASFSLDNIPETAENDKGRFLKMSGAQCDQITVTVLDRPILSLDYLKVVQMGECGETITVRHRDTVDVRKHRRDTRSLRPHKMGRSLSSTGGYTKHKKRIHGSSLSCISLEMGNAEFMLPWLLDFGAFVDNALWHYKCLKAGFRKLFRPALSTEEEFSYHGRKQKEEKGRSVSDGPPPRISIKLKSFRFVFEDDPFQARLGFLYHLAVDEAIERLNREDLLNQKIAEKQSSNNPISREKEEQVRKHLAAKNSRIFVERAKYVLQDLPEHVAQLTVSILDLSVEISSDSQSFYTRDGLYRMLEKLDSGFAKDKMVFDDLMGGILSVKAKQISVLARDYPLPIVSCNNIELGGTIIGGDLLPWHPASVDMRMMSLDSSTRLEVRRSVVPVKLYSDLVLKAEKMNVNYGLCFVPLMAEISMAANRLTPKSADPSPVLPWWDKARYLIQGKFELSINDFDLGLVHSTVDPYDTSRLLKLTSEDLVLGFDGKSGMLCEGKSLAFWVVQPAGLDLDLQKCFLYFPRLSINSTLEWALKDFNHSSHYITLNAGDSSLAKFREARGMDIWSGKMSSPVEAKQERIKDMEEILEDIDEVIAITLPPLGPYGDSYALYRSRRLSVSVDATGEQSDSAIFPEYPFIRGAGLPGTFKNSVSYMILDSPTALFLKSFYELYQLPPLPERRFETFSGPRAPSTGLFSRLFDRVPVSIQLEGGLVLSGWQGSSALVLGPIEQIGSESYPDYESLAAFSLMCQELKCSFETWQSIKNPMPPFSLRITEWLTERLWIDIRPFKAYFFSPDDATKVLDVVVRVNEESEYSDSEGIAETDQPRTLGQSLPQDATGPTVRRVLSSSSSFSDDLVQISELLMKAKCRGHFFLETTLLEFKQGTGIENASRIFSVENRSISTLSESLSDKQSPQRRQDTIKSLLASGLGPKSDGEGLMAILDDSTKKVQIRPPKLEIESSENAPRRPHSVPFSARSNVTSFDDGMSAAELVEDPFSPSAEEEAAKYPQSYVLENVHLLWTNDNRREFNSWMDVWDRVFDPKLAAREVEALRSEVKGDVDQEARIESQKDKRLERFILVRMQYPQVNLQAVDDSLDNDAGCIVLCGNSGVAVGSLKTLSEAVENVKWEYEFSHLRGYALPPGMNVSIAKPSASFSSAGGRQQTNGLEALLEQEKSIDLHWVPDEHADYVNDTESPGGLLSRIMTAVPFGFAYDYYNGSYAVVARTLLSGITTSQGLPQANGSSKDESSHILLGIGGLAHDPLALSSFTMHLPALPLRVSAVQFNMLMSIINKVLLSPIPKLEAMEKKFEKFMYHRTLYSNRTAESGSLAADLHEIDAVVKRIKDLSRKISSLEMELYTAKLDTENSDSDALMNWVSNLRTARERYTELKSKERMLLWATRNEISRRNENLWDLRLECSIENFLIELTERGGIFTEIGIENMSVRLFQNEDESGSTEMLVGSFAVHNHLPDAYYTELVSEMTENKAKVHDWVLRLFWKTMPRVSGIGVFDHFEVNLVPLEISLTAEWFSRIVSFFFYDSTKSGTERDKGYRSSRPLSIAESPANKDLSRARAGLAPNVLTSPRHTRLRSDLGRSLIEAKRKSDFRSTDEEDSTTKKDVPEFRTPLPRGTDDTSIILSPAVNAIVSQSRKHRRSQSVTSTDIGTRRVQDKIEIRPEKSVTRRRSIDIGEDTGNALVSPASASRTPKRGSRTKERRRDLASTESDVDVMQQRAELYKTIIYMKISKAKLLVSFHSNTSNAQNLEKFPFTLRELVYRNLHNSWQGIFNKIKSDVLMDVAKQTTLGLGIIGHKLFRGPSTSGPPLDVPPRGTPKPETPKMGSHDWWEERHRASLDIQRRSVTPLNKKPSGLFPVQSDDGLSMDSFEEKEEVINDEEGEEEEEGKKSGLRKLFSRFTRDKSKDLDSTPTRSHSRSKSGSGWWGKSKSSDKEMIRSESSDEQSNTKAMKLMGDLYHPHDHEHEGKLPRAISKEKEKKPAGHIRTASGGPPPLAPRLGNDMAIGSGGGLTLDALLGKK